MDQIDARIEELKELLESKREEMPLTPLDAEKKAMDIGLLEEELAELYEKKKTVTVPKPSDDGLTEQIRMITDELMQIEVKMIKAEMDGDDSERIKLQLSANALRDRRQTLIEQVRNSSQQSASTDEDDLRARVEKLEKEVAELRDLMYRILKE